MDLKAKGELRSGRAKASLLLSAIFMATFCLARPAPLQAQHFTTEVEVLKSLTYTFGGVTGLEMISGIRKDGNTTVAGVNGAAAVATEDTRFRIGSQSKMFTAAVMLEVMNDNGLTLDTTIAQVVNGNPGVAAALPEGIVERAGDLTLRQLLNMGTDLPNYLGGVPDGETQSLFDLWQASRTGGATNGYGQVDGFTENDATAHKDMAELALEGQATPPPGGLFSGIYSNSNAIILALIAEGLNPGKTFDELLATWLTDNGFAATALQTAQGDTAAGLDMVGTFNGQKIDDLDPTIPWTSGAVITTMGDLLKALEIFNDSSDPTQAQRMDSSNTTVINMHGMPTIYGLGLMSLDFKFISNLMGAPTSLSPVVSTGHGGSIAGAASFSGWLTSGDTNLDLGLATYANLSNGFSNGGIYTETAAESLFVTLAEHLYRHSRADGMSLNSGSDVTINYGSTGGFSTWGSYGSINSLKFVKGAGQEIPYIAYFDWDALVPGALAITLDPVFIHYSTDDGLTSFSETVFEVGAGGAELDDWVRMEGYSGNKTGTATYTLLKLDNSNVSDTLHGQVAVYGSNAVALRADRDIYLWQDSVLEAHGYNSTALALTDGSGSTSTVTGKIRALGSNVTGIDVDAGGGGGNLFIGREADIIAYSYAAGQQAVDFSNTAYDPLKNGATGLKLSQDAAVEIEGASIVSTDYSIYFANTTTSSQVALNGAYVYGQIKAADSSENNTLTTAVDPVTNKGTSLVADGYSQVVIDGVKAVNLDKTTTVSWTTTDLPEMGRGIVVVNDFDKSASSGLSDFGVSFGDRGILNYTVRDGVVTLSGLNPKAYRSPNASAAYTPWQQASRGTGYGLVFVDDIDNLTPEPYVTLATAGLDAHRLNVGLAQRALFPDQPSGSVYSAPAYLSDKPSGADAKSATLAALYDRQVASSLIDNWSPADPEARSFLDDGGLAMGAAPLGGPGSAPRFIFNYFHQASSRDDDRYSGYDHDRDGLLMGAAVDLADGRFSLAGYFGWSKGEIDYNYLRAEADTESTFAGVMGRWRKGINDDLTARFTGHFDLSRVDNDLDRTVIGQGGAFSRLSDSVKQHYVGFGLEAALDWTPFGDPGTRLSPWLALDYVQVKQDGWDESLQAGIGAPAMWTKGFDGEAFYSTIGAALAHDFRFSDSHVLTVKASAAWEHQFGDDQFSTEGGFKFGGGSTFRASSLAMDRDAAVLGVTLDSLHKLDNGDLFGLSAGYETRLMDNGHDQQMNLALEYRF